MSNNNKKSGKKPVIKRILTIVLLGLAGFFLILLSVNIYVHIKANKYIMEDMAKFPDKVDCIIIPGAGLTADNKPGTVLQDRLDNGLELYKKGISDRILMSGDHGDDYHNEVRAMKDYAIEKGVPADHIFMDHAGFTTYETMIRARDVFQVKSCIIVTQKYHLLRSVYIARGLGLDAYGYPADIHINELKYLPLEMREFFARIKAFFSVITKPEPTYLGEPIPISGSGALTD